MVVHTRSATSSPTKPRSKSTPVSAATLKKDEQHNVKLFLLPKNSSPEARFLLLRHPRDRSRQRYFFCPQQGLFEFTNVAAPPSDPRSVLCSPNDEGRQKAQSDTEIESKQSNGICSGYVKKAAGFCVATPFDIAFLLLPYLWPKKSSTKTLFQPLDDIFEEHFSEEKHLRYIFLHGRQQVEDAAGCFCDTIDVGDDKMYRFSQRKLLENLLERVNVILSNKLPPSLEEKFVYRALEKPVLSIKREETVASICVETVADGDMDSVSESFTSESTTVGTAISSLHSETSVTSSITTLADDSVPAEILHLQRSRITFDFISVSYFPSEIAQALSKALETKDSPIDFTPLVDWKKSLEELRAAAIASRSITDFSRKRSLEDEEAADDREGKKRKAEEDEKRRKAGESKGVRDLKKVNTTGMQKMNAFFKPAIAKART